MLVLRVRPRIVLELGTLRTEFLIYLTECINEMVLGSQLPHKIVDLLFTIAHSNNYFTVLWGS